MPNEIVSSTYSNRITSPYLNSQISFYSNCSEPISYPWKGVYLACGTLIGTLATSSFIGWYLSVPFHILVKPAFFSLIPGGSMMLLFLLIGSICSTVYYQYQNKKHAASYTARTLLTSQSSITDTELTTPEISYARNIKNPPQAPIEEIDPIQGLDATSLDDNNLNTQGAKLFPNKNLAVPTESSIDSQTHSHEIQQSYQADRKVKMSPNDIRARKQHKIPILKQCKELFVQKDSDLNQSDLTKKFKTFTI